MSPSEKRCSKCREVKAASAFSRDATRRDGLRQHCRACRATKDATYHAANRDKLAARMRANNMRRAGADVGDVREIHPPVSHTCDICGADAPGGPGSWHLDHDHETGKLRGWLCSKCNIGLGHLKDSPVNAAAILVYLAAHGRALTTEQLSDFLNVYERAVLESSA